MPLEWGGSSGDYSVPLVPSVVRNKPEVRRPDGDGWRPESRPEARRPDSDRPESTTPSQPSTVPPSEPEQQASPEQRGEEISVRNVMAVEHLMIGLKRIHDICEREYGGQLDRVRTIHPPSDPPPARQERPASYAEPKRVEPSDDSTTIVTPVHRAAKKPEPAGGWNAAFDVLSADDKDSVKWGQLIKSELPSGSFSESLKLHIRFLISRAVSIRDRMVAFNELVAASVGKANGKSTGTMPVPVSDALGYFEHFMNETRAAVADISRPFQPSECKNKYLLAIAVLNHVTSLVKALLPRARDIEQFASLSGIVGSITELKRHSVDLVKCFVQEYSQDTGQMVEFVSAREGDNAFSEFRTRISELLVQCLNDWRRPSSGEPLEPAGDGGDGGPARDQPAARRRDGGDDGRRAREEPAADEEQRFPARVIHTVPEYGQSDDDGAGWTPELDGDDVAFGGRIMSDTDFLEDLKERERVCLDNVERYRAFMKENPATGGKLTGVLKSERTQLGIIQADILAIEARMEDRAESRRSITAPNADDVEVSRLGQGAAKLSKDMTSIVRQIGIYKQRLSELPEDSVTEEEDIAHVLTALELELSSLRETSLTVDEELIAARSRVMVRRFEESRAELGPELYDSAMEVAVHPEQVTVADERMVERRLQQRGMEDGSSDAVLDLVREFRSMQDVVRGLQQPAARRWSGARLEAMRSRPGLYKAWLRASLADGSLRHPCCDDAPEQLREIDGWQQQQQYDV